MNRILLMLLSCLSAIACNISDSEDELIVFPKTEQIAVSWKVIDDALEDDDRRTSQFSIQVNGDQSLPSGGWSLYFNQFPHAIYLSPSQEKLFQVENINGDLYRILPSDSFPRVESGEVVQLGYKSHWPLVKKTHGPKGVFFVVQEGTPHERVVSVINFEILPFPSQITYSTSRGKIPVHHSADIRYDMNQGISDIPLAKVNRIVPTPFRSRSTGTVVNVKSNMKILFDQGLEREADHLATFLNQVLQDPISSSDSETKDTGVIYLRQSSLTIDGKSEEAYRLILHPSTGIEITGADPSGVFYGIQTFKALLPVDAFKEPAASIDVPAMTIEDIPRFGYRGLHLDIARNFQDYDQIRKVIQLMAFYKLNRLHLHLTDDEGWRLEIPGLPELTEVGSRRGWSTKESPVLPPAYGSGAIVDGEENSGSGHLSREQFIQLLRYANDHHIQIIPEINGPGHARAAIESMRIRYDRLMQRGKETEAKEFLLHDPNDSSRYSSAQNYDDNVICVCRESVYHFLKKVVDEVIRMYEEASVSLPVINGGGDEVPGGAWERSPICTELIGSEPSVSSEGDLYGYFFARYNEIVKAHDVQLGGWEEIAMTIIEEDGKPTHFPDTGLLKQNYLTYAWNSIVGGGGEDMAYKLANLGFKVVMCNASNLYFDMAYNYEPDEPGLFWAGFVDTKNAFETAPFNLFASIYQDDVGNVLDGFELAQSKELLLPEAQLNIIGIQGEIWSETILNGDMLEYLMLPKLTALAERAWAIEPAWETATNVIEAKREIDQAWNLFANRLGKIELPRLDHLQGGFFYRIPPPGARISNGILQANVTFPGLQIRYTVDGSDPNPYSLLYDGQVKVEQGQLIRLRAFNNVRRASRESSIIAPVAN